MVTQFFAQQDQFRRDHRGVDDAVFEGNHAGVWAADLHDLNVALGIEPHLGRGEFDDEVGIAAEAADADFLAAQLLRRIDAFASDQHVGHAIVETCDIFEIGAFQDRVNERRAAG